MVLSWSQFGLPSNFDRDAHKIQLVPEQTLEPTRGRPPSTLVLTVGPAGIPWVPTCMVFPFAPRVPTSSSPWRGTPGSHRSLLPGGGQPGLALSTAQGEGEGRTTASYACAQGAALLPGNVEAGPGGCCGYRCTRSAACILSGASPVDSLELVLAFFPPFFPPPPNQQVVSEPLAPFNPESCLHGEITKFWGDNPPEEGFLTRAHSLYLDGF